MSGKKPYKSGSDLSSEIKEPWFFEVDKKEAERILQESLSKNEGNMCVRRSSRANCFAISTINSKRELRHYTVSLVNGRYVLDVTKKPSPMRSLQDVVDYFTAECPGTIPIKKCVSYYNLVIENPDGHTLNNNKSRNNKNNHSKRPSSDTNPHSTYVNEPQTPQPPPRQTTRSISHTCSTSTSPHTLPPPSKNGMPPVQKACNPLSKKKTAKIPVSANPSTEPTYINDGASSNEDDDEGYENSGGFSKKNGNYGNDYM